MRAKSVLLVALWLNISMVRAELTENEFRTQYETAAKKLEAFYTSVTMHATLTKLNWPQQFSPEKYVAYLDGGNLRVDVYRPDKVADDASQGELHATVATSDATFTVTREGVDKPFVLTKIDSQNERTNRVAKNRARSISGPFADPRGGTILQRLKRPGVKITKVEAESQNGEPLVKVSYTEDTTANGKPWRFIGWYLLSKDKCWALRGSSVGAAIPDSEPLRNEVGYEGQLGGIPLMKTFERWVEKGTDRLRIEHYELTEIQPEAPAASEFKLAAFGLPDIRQEKESNYWLFLIGGGVLLIAAAILIARVVAARRPAQ